MYAPSLALLVVLLHSGLALSSSLEADQGNWTVDGCILVRMAAQISVHPDKKMPNQTVSEDVPVSALVSPKSTCEFNNNTQVMILHWGSEDQNNPGVLLNRNLTMIFALNKTTIPPSYGVSKINAVYELRTYNKTINQTQPDKNTTIPVNITVTDFISMTTFAMNPRQFVVPQNRSYLCMNAGSESLEAELHSSDENSGDPGNKLANATLTIKLAQFDAFRSHSLPDGVFQTPSDCSYRPNDVVPIIVGCALAGMVVMVLVAYMVGRSRSRARGYMSV